MGDEAESIKKHIKGQLKKGYSKDIIIESLLHAGFPRNEINQALEELRTGKKTAPRKDTGSPAIQAAPKKSWFSGLFAPAKKTEAGKPEKIAVKKPAAEKLPEKKPEAEKPEKISFKKPEKPQAKKPENKSFITRLLGKKPEAEKPEKTAIKKPEKKTAAERPPEKKPAIEKPPAAKPAATIYPAKSKRRAIIFTAIALLLLIFVIFGLAYALPTRCKTEQCFISKANKCLAATFTNQIEGTTFHYETNHCILRKTIIAMDPGEPQATVTAFMGKDMRCKYIKNDFSPLFINSITAYLEACEGPLKDKILELT